MATNVINLDEKLRLFSDQWYPKIVAEVNDCHLKLVKLQGDFVWHSHSDTDEAFLVLEGRLRIDFRDSAATLEKGEMLVVRKGVEHKPFAEVECHVLLIERAGTVNTGDTAYSDLSKGPGERI